jgi:hypothetical protein
METMTEIRNKAKELGVTMPHGVKKAELAKLVDEASASAVAPTGDYVRKLENPELNPVKIMNDVVADTVSEEQRRAKFEAQVREKLEFEKLERIMRKEAQIAENKQKQLEKYNLKYDIVDMRNQCESILAAHGGQFVIDKKPDGSLAGTYHMYANGKSNCGNLAQPLATILRDVRVFCKTKIDKDMPVRNDMVRSQFTGAPIATPVHIVGVTSATNPEGEFGSE